MMEKGASTLSFVVGPSAVGKTGLAMTWAEELEAEIVSCDAFCVYQGMDIGTAKPTVEEQARVRHHGLDLVAVRERFSVGRYASYAERAVAEISSRGKRVLVAGGSGFYLKSFFAPVTDALVIPEEVRQGVEELAVLGGLGALRKALQEEAGETGDVDVQNPRRVANALMRFRASGLTPSKQKEALARLPEPLAGWRKEIVWLEREDVSLRERILARAKEMVNGGLIEEVRTLWEAGLAENASAARAVGYRESLAFLAGQGVLPEAAGQFSRDVTPSTQEELTEQIAMNTWLLARKQRTWFRHQLGGLSVRTLPLPGEGEPACPFAAD